MTFMQRMKEMLLTPQKTGKVKTKMLPLRGFKECVGDEPIQLERTLLDYNRYRMNEYMIRLILGYKLYCSDKDYNRLLKNILYEIREEIYGDVIKKVRDFERVYYSGDGSTREIERALDNIYKEMEI